VNVVVDVDLTPETAESLDRFRQMFWSGRFLLLALSGANALGYTDVASLYRVMDRVLFTAAGSQLCQVSERPTPAEALTRAKANAQELKQALTHLQELVVDWYAAQPETTQQAVQELIVAVDAWLKSLAQTASPELQEVIEAVLVLIGEVRPQTVAENSVLRVVR
jgi:hypothetical protein